MSSRTPRVLWIDDDPSFFDWMKVVAEMLGPGWQFVFACGGEMGLRLLCKEGPFDLVVTDFMMPEVNGADVLHAIRSGRTNTGSCGTRPDVPVIVCTILESGAVLEKFDAHLQRPFAWETLADQLERVIAGKSEVGDS
jgi:CheY-like chemotaxis protein